MVTGVGALTRYAFGWVIIPVTVFLIFFGGQRRVLYAVVALVAFLLVLAPWVVRNFAVSGTPFGTAGLRWWKGPVLFRDSNWNAPFIRICRRPWGWRMYLHKFLANLHLILRTRCPDWAAAGSACCS